MKKIIFSLLAVALVFSSITVPVTTQAALSQSQITQLRQLLIRLLAHQNPPASLMAASSIPRNQ